MLTVKEFKDLGVVFVDGDVCGKIFYKDWWKSATSLFDDEVVTYFAWRPLNTLPAWPKFLCDIDYENHSWRPSLDQSVNIYSCDNGEVTVKYVDGSEKPSNTLGYCANKAILPEMTLKPVFTQSMAEAGESPRVGMMVKYPIGEGELALGADSDGVCIVIESGIYKRVRSIDLKPIDTRTPKQKAVDEAMVLCHVADKPTLELAYDLWVGKC